jgi:excisionase family DNA binding protein
LHFGILRGKIVTASIATVKMLSANKNMEAVVMSNGDSVLTVEEVGKRLRISRPLAYQLVAREDFPKLHLGRRILIPVDAFEAWIRKNTFGGGVA